MAAGSSSSRGEYLRSHSSFAEVPVANESIGMEVDPLRWVQTEDFTFAARRIPPVTHRGSVRLESGERASERKPNRRKSDAARDFGGWQVET
jgi:hypothetical protein